MALSVVTFNIDGGEGTRHEKKKMIDRFLSEHLPSLLYIQENLWRKDYIKDHVPMIKKKYNAVSHKHRDAAVFYRRDVLRDEGSEQLMKIFGDAFSDKDHLHFVKFRERASFSKLTEIKTGTSFIAISWHGEYRKITDPQKKDKFKDLLSVIKELKSKTKLPVILGGDFNITLHRVKKIIEEQGLEVYDYEPINRKTVIDFFVVTPDVGLSEVSALGDYMYINVSVPQRQQGVSALGGAVASENDNEDSEEELDDYQARSLSYTKYRNGRGKSDTIGDVEELKGVFDHDPVQVLVTFVNTNESEDSEEESADSAQSSHSEEESADSAVQSSHSEEESADSAQSSHSEEESADSVQSSHSEEESADSAQSSHSEEESADSAQSSHSEEESHQLLYSKLRNVSVD